MYLIFYEREKITEKSKKVLKKWISDHGACNFDIKNQDIILNDGGLFSIEEKDVMWHKVIGTKNFLMACIK